MDFNVRPPVPVIQCVPRAVVPGPPASLTTVGVKMGDQNVTKPRRIAVVGAFCAVYGIRTPYPTIC
eukprot:749003-Hanusia_phi.AAC.4